jgi:hypothetical protein
MNTTPRFAPAAASSRSSSDSDHAVPLKVTVVYDGLPAGRRAVSTITRMLNQAEEPMHLVPALWRFDVMDDANCRARATADAVASDLLVLATDRPDALPTHVESWVSDFIARRRGTSVTILAMWGMEDEWTVSLLERSAAGGLLPATTSFAARPDSSPCTNPFQAAVAA